MKKLNLSQTEKMEHRVKLLLNTTIVSIFGNVNSIKKRDYFNSEEYKKAIGVACRGGVTISDNIDQLTANVLGFVLNHIKVDYNYFK